MLWKAFVIRIVCLKVCFVLLKCSRKNFALFVGSAKKVRTLRKMRECDAKKYVPVEDIKDYLVFKFQQNTSHKLTKSKTKKEIRGEIFSAIIEKIDKPVPKKIELRSVALIKDTVVNYPS